MHQSIILKASPASKIDKFLDEHLPKDRQVHTIEERVKEGGKTLAIFVEDIRDLRDNIKTGGFGSTARVFIFRDAALMRPEAQNAFLKHLEEPAENTYFVLVTPTPQSLLETIRSRCVYYELPTESATTTDPQIAFISKGEAAEIEKLTKNKSYLKKKTDIYTQAKVLIGGSNFDKLKLITDISGDRAKTLEVISAGLHITRVQIKAKYSPSLIEQADRLSTAYDRIQGNGNVRLQLLNSVI